MVCVPGGGAGTSSIKLNGGAAQTFQANATAWSYQTFGDILGNPDTITYYIGNMKIDSTQAGYGNGQNLYTNFENSTDGTTVTTAILNAATVGGNGTWAACGQGAGPASAETVSTSGQLSLVNPVDVLGTQFTDSGSTRGMQFSMAATVSDYCEYDFTSFSPVRSEFWWGKTTNPTSDTTSFINMGIGGGNIGGSDGAGVMWNNGAVYLESNLNPNGPADLCSGTCNGSGFFPYTVNTKYGFWMQVQEYVVSGTSVTSLAIGTGSKSFTTQGGLAYVAGQPIIAVNTTANWMSGTVTSYSGTSLVINVVNVGGSGTLASWSFSGSTHTLKIYDSTCALLATQQKVANPNNPGIWVNFQAGRGGDSGTPAQFFYFDNFIGNYTTGQFIPCQ